MSPCKSNEYLIQNIVMTLTLAEMFFINIVVLKHKYFSPENDKSSNRVKKIFSGVEIFF